MQTILNYLSNDGRTLYYRANDIVPNSYAIYKYDIAARRAEPVFTELGIWSVDDVKETANGDELLLAKAVGANMLEYYRYVPTTKALTPLIGKDEREDYRAAFGPGAAPVLRQAIVDRVRNPGNPTAPGPADMPLLWDDNHQPRQVITESQYAILVKWRNGTFVEDEGPGVPESSRDAIFNRFHSIRPDEDFGRHSGLGLAIAKAIAEGHGGRIEVEDRRDGRSGARFVVWFPGVQ